MYTKTKTILLVTVLVMMITGTIENTHPYFPIEISRIGSNGVTQALFVLGSLCASYTAFLEGGKNNIFVCMAMFGLILLAAVSDEVSKVVHTAGLMITVASLGLNVYLGTDIKKRIILLGCAFLCLGYVLSRFYYLSAIDSLDAMYQTHTAMLLYGQGSEQQLFVYRCFGIFQWAFLFTLSFLL